MNQVIYAINHSFINETIINIYLSYTSYIYIYLLYIFTHYIINIYKQQTMKIINHMNTRVLHGNPVAGKKTMESFHQLQISFAKIKYWLGQSTP